MSARFVPSSHRPTVRLMTNDYGRAEYTAPVVQSAREAREAYETAKRVTALKRV